MANWATEVMDEEEPVLPTNRFQDDTEMDITPMIDCTFLLLIFFTVTSSPDAQTALQLASAKYGIGVAQNESLIISLAESGGASADIYLADGKRGEPLRGTAAEQEAEIQQAVEAARAEGKDKVLNKAERGVAYRDVARVASASAAAGEVRLNLAVMQAE